MRFTISCVRRLLLKRRRFVTQRFLQSLERYGFWNMSRRVICGPQERKCKHISCLRRSRFRIPKTSKFGWRLYPLVFGKHGIIIIIIIMFCFYLPVRTCALVYFCVLVGFVFGTDLLCCCTFTIILVHYNALNLIIILQYRFVWCLILFEGFIAYFNQMKK